MLRRPPIWIAPKAQQEWPSGLSTVPEPAGRHVRVPGGATRARARTLRTTMVSMTLSRWPLTWPDLFEDHANIKPVAICPCWT
jgi:hypothetical protein